MRVARAVAVQDDTGWSTLSPDDVGRVWVGEKTIQKGSLRLLSTLSSHLVFAKNSRRWGLRRGISDEEIPSKTKRVSE